LPKVPGLDSDPSARLHHLTTGIALTRGQDDLRRHLMNRIASSRLRTRHRRRSQPERRRRNAIN